MFLPGDRDLDLVRDGLSHVSLHGKHVAQLAVVGLRPEMFVACRADQLRVNTNPIAVSHHRALNDGINAEHSGNFRY